jgi:hypothetical protein
VAAYPSTCAKVGEHGNANGVGVMGDVVVGGSVDFGGIALIAKYAPIPPAMNKMTIIKIKNTDIYYMKVKLFKSPRTEKKWRVVFEDGTHVDFGQRGYTDYTKHKDPKHMQVYLNRHGRMGETWTKKGYKTAGFWARWLLWSSPTLNGAMNIIHKKFGINISKR